LVSSGQLIHFIQRGWIQFEELKWGVLDGTYFVTAEIWVAISADDVESSDDDDDNYKVVDIDNCGYKDDNDE
jgi:hypothetical protein